MLVKYYLSDNIKAPFKNFTLGLGNAWAGPANNGVNLKKLSKMRTIASHTLIWPLWSTTIESLHYT